MVENARRLALQTTASSVIPALKDSTGEWRRSAGEKANVFAKTFAEKFILPGMTPNEYSELQFIRPGATGQQVSADSAHRVLMKLNEDSATGPDLLPTRILKVCADALCDPVSQLVQSILQWGQWPSAWRLHWIVPLHKKSIYDRQLQVRAPYPTDLQSSRADAVGISAAGDRRPMPIRREPIRVYKGQGKQG